MAVAHEASALELEDRQRPDQFRLQRRTEFGVLAADDVGDGQRVAGVGLAGSLATALAVRAPGRNVQDLMAGSAQGGD